MFTPENLSLVVESYSIKVSLPMKTLCDMPPGMTYAGAINTLSIRSYNAKNDEERTQFEMAKALMEYAYECGAELEEIEKGKRKLFCIFRFSRLEALKAFKNNSKQVVIQKIAQSDSAGEEAV